MVNKVRINKNQKEDRLSMRHSLIVWVAGAVLGWVVAVVSVWTALNTTDSDIADNSPTQAEKLEKIMPAAGNEKEPEKN